MISSIEPSQCGPLVALRACRQIIRFRDVRNPLNRSLDIIVADECHRGYTSAELSVWWRTIDHLDGVKIGLTADAGCPQHCVLLGVVFRHPRASCEIG